MLAKYPPMMPLDRKDTPTYCGPNFLKLYGVLIIADSGSYDVLDEQVLKDKRIEILRNIGSLTVLWEQSRQR